MNRIQQIDPASTTGKTRETLDAVKAKLGKVPNALRVFANSQAALDGYLGLSGALQGGILPPKLRDQIALTVAEINGCGYCLSSHTVTGRMAGLSQADINAARHVKASDAKSDAVLKLARSISIERGKISDEELGSARAAGLSDSEIVEIVFHVALNSLTNFANNVARTVIDFPEVTPGEFPGEPAGAA